MLDWLQKKIGPRADHPMYDAVETARLLAEVPVEDPLRATEEIAAWLESLVTATGFSPEERLGVISQVDEAGQPSLEALMTEYLAGEFKRDPARYRRWQVLVKLSEKLAAAYLAVIGEFERAKAAKMAEHMPLVTARAMRAVFTQLRLALMRYAGDTERIWGALYQLFSFAHANRIATTPVRPYPGETQATTARHELMRAVMLEVAAPQSLPPRQIELTARIAARHASAFAFSETPGERLPFYVDLVQARPPVTVTPQLKAGPTLRFFGPGTVTEHLNDIVKRDASPQQAAEQRFGEEFTTQEKLDALQRLGRYWGANPPRREHARTRISNKLEVVFGLDAIRQRVGATDAPVTAPGAANLTIQFDDQKGAAQQTVAPTIETWQLKDISLHGLGAVTTRRGAALKIGALIAYRLQDTDQWCVGILRRLQTDSQNNSQVGAQVLSKSPRLLELKRHGSKAGGGLDLQLQDQASYSRHSMNGVHLPADPAAGAAESLLLDPESYLPQEAFETVVENNPRRLQLADLLERGDGYHRVAFKWVEAEAARQPLSLA